MNKVILMGRLTRDPEIRYSQGDKPMAIASFSLAVDRKFKRQGEPEADFFNCTAFGKQGEFVERYLTQGTKVLVTGRIQNDNYTNREGQKVYSTKIMLDEIEFAEGKKKEGSGNAGGGSGSGTSGNEKNEGNVDEGFMDIPEDADDLPFK